MVCLSFALSSLVLVPSHMLGHSLIIVKCSIYLIPPNQDNDPNPLLNAKTVTVEVSIISLNSLGLLAGTVFSKGLEKLQELKHREGPPLANTAY